MYTMTPNKHLNEYILDATDYLTTLDEGTPEWVEVKADLDAMEKEQRLRRAFGEDKY